jgi:hypothetical protein
MPKKVLFISLPDDQPSDRFHCQSCVILDGHEWNLIGRVSAKSPRGIHYFCQLYRDDVEFKGWFMFDDMQNGGRAVRIDDVPEYRSNSWLLAYLKKS